MTSKCLSDFYCQNCFHSFARENKCESHKRVYKNKDFCNVLVLSKDTKILEFSQHQKYDKAPFITYTDLECSTGKIDGCKNNPEKSSTTKVRKYILSVFSRSTIS